MKKLILIDGNAIVHRAFHAMPQTFRTPDGELTNAVYGFTSMLLNILNNEKPDYIACSFDLKGKTFRHEQYEDYKATRPKGPDELYSQFPRIKEIVRAFQIPIYEVQGYEADDVLGTLARKAEAHTKDLMTYIVTGDMDTTQLITDTVRVLTPIKGFSDSLIYDRNKVLDKYGLTPEQITDMKGLQGDNSDNIKGVRGIGPKTAKALLQKYGTIENLYEHLDEITGSTHTKLAEGRDSAFQSKELATIITDVPITFDLNACTTHEYDTDKIFALFDQLQFKSLYRKLGVFNTHSAAQKIEADNTQPSLF